MWRPRVEEIEGGRARRVTLTAGPRTATVADLLAGWVEGDGRSRGFRRALVEAPYAAYFWEVAPLLRSRLDRPFECVLVEATTLDGVRADDRAFAEHFRGPVVRFTNLSGDAELVAPCPTDSRETPPQVYAHLATFSRGAPSRQQDAFWREVGLAVRGALERRADDAPLWLSTSGLGVYWLHVRLDRRPKYYTHAPYRRATPPSSTTLHP